MEKVNDGRDQRKDEDLTEKRRFVEQTPVTDKGGPSVTDRGREWWPV